MVAHTFDGIVDGETKDKGSSFKDYAKELMSKSPIPGIPSIVESDNKFRISFKTLFFIFCTIGFVYQTTEFVLHFLTYPYTMDVNTIKAREVTLPAITICDKLRFLKSAFCEANPYYCSAPGDIKAFCKSNRALCQDFNDRDRDVKIPKERYTYFDNDKIYMHYKDITTHSRPSVSTFARDSIIESAPKHVEQEEFEERFVPLDGEIFKCYSWNLRTNSSLYPVKVNISDHLAMPLFKIQHYLFHEGIYIPSLPSESLLFVHSPYSFIEHSLKGHAIRFLKNYKINIRLEEFHTLPAPYPSNCTDYIKSWEEGNESDPRSSKACHEKCVMDYILPLCKCWPNFIHYPNDAPVCASGRISGGGCTWFNPYAFIDHENNCRIKCRPDCEKTEYVYSVIEHSDSDEKKYHIDESSRWSEINIMIDTEVKQYKQIPKYESLELFSNFGGFIGMWLGVALISVADFLESIIMIATYNCRTRQRQDFKLPQLTMA